MEYQNSKKLDILIVIRELNMFIIIITIQSSQVIRPDAQDQTFTLIQKIMSHSCITFNKQ